MINADIAFFLFFGAVVYLRGFVASLRDQTGYGIQFYTIPIKYGNRLVKRGSMPTTRKHVAKALLWPIGFFSLLFSF